MRPLRSLLGATAARAAVLIRFAVGDLFLVLVGADGVSRDARLWKPFADLPRRLAARDR